MSAQQGESAGDGQGARDGHRARGDRAVGLVVIGLTGGIGAGKSAVARAFARAGAAVSDSDATARALLKTPGVRDKLKEWWGPGVLDAEGEVDRAFVAARVFADAAQRSRLEGLIHPLIHLERGEEMQRAIKAGARVFVIDAPLLLEAGLETECDAVVFVDTPREVRLARVKATRGWDEHELDRREAAQWSLERKRAAARFVVDNSADGGPVSEGSHLDAQARTVLTALLGRGWTGPDSAGAGA